MSDATKLEFTPLEKAVLDWVRKRDQAATVLYAQLSTAKVQRRENTGHGFYTWFEVDRASTPALGGERWRDGPEIQIGGLQHGMGSMLWLIDGYADQIEGYCYGEDITGFNLWDLVFKLS